MNPGDELERVAECWDRTARERAEQPIQGWMDSAIVLEAYVQPRITGSPRKNWLVGLAESLRLPRDGRWLSLGCGSAGQEIYASQQGVFGSLVAVDASSVSLEEARRTAVAGGVSNVEFRQSDLNRLDLPAGEHDVVLMNMSLHHVRELATLLAQVNRALKGNGYFIVNEYIGPRQFQFTDLQLGIVRDLLAVMPERWRRDSTTGGIKAEYVRMPVEHWNVADPSEAIRSDRIVPEIEKQFRIERRIDYGGTILNLLLEHIVHNFDPQKEEDVAAIRLLARFEEILIREGVLRSDFTVIVARKRSALGAGMRRLLAGV